MRETKGSGSRFRGSWNGFFHGYRIQARGQEMDLHEIGGSSTAHGNIALLEGTQIVLIVEVQYSL